MGNKSISPKETNLMTMVMRTRSEPELLFKIRRLIKSDPSILDKREEHGWTPLMIASKNSRTKSTESTVQLLIELGADVDLQDYTGHTALMCASTYSGTDSTEQTVQMLIN